jgi:hypothetical protein
MKDYIINCFILQEKNTLLDIYNYIKRRYNETIEINDIKIELTKLIKNNILFLNETYYKLTKEGNVILDDHKYYYSKVIINFYKKYNKNHIKYELKEIRQEQKMLRNYLIMNKKQICIICEKKLPLCLLETAHLKQRCILNHNEKNDKNIVEFMCRYCHSLYDNGFLTVYNGLLQVSPLINNYDLYYNKNKPILNYNTQNEKYFIFHYTYVYKYS